ncbi:energy-coupling factor transporter transmembrane protein EcfT [Patescibacteria group bacterium]|nr:energy-coupling factor transporter transmembrane protein EcfT [Patescibacteria group bacterium]
MNFKKNFFLTISKVTKLPRNHYPILGIFLIWLLIVIANFKPSTFLTGGDNLHPEFNLILNIKRSIFAVWQEYQGVGLLGGMGHASDLVRQLFLYPFSLVMPTSLLRFSYTMLTLLLGAIGSYYFILKITAKGIADDRKKIVSLVGSVFYLLNLATLQQYYTPYEVFTAHFAALPWLLLTSFNFLKMSNFRNSFFLALVLLLATPASYVPTLFVVYLMATSLAWLILFLFKESSFKNYLKYVGIVFAINAFWLLPFIYFTVFNSQTVVGSKINQMASPTIFLKNKEVGSIFDAMLLKGFWFNNVEPDMTGKFIYMLGSWRNHLGNLGIKIIGYFLFSISAFGLLKSLIKRTPIKLSLAGIFIFSFAMIAVATPPFSWLSYVLRNYIPLFSEVFRFPFTKFSVLAALSYSVFLTIGIDEILNYLKRFSLKATSVFAILIISLIVIFNLPTFKGSLFYYKEQIKIPQDYFDLFDYLKTQDKDTRIADFPQFQNWEWSFYKWGYSGSGFTWYGIEQPILARSTDTWSFRNENYYWEITNALYSNDPIQFDKLLNKYQINWLWIDKSVDNPNSIERLFIPQTEDLFSKTPSLKKVKTFGNISLYKVSLKDKVQNFVFTKENLPDVNSYKWAEYDKAYMDLGNYYSGNNKAYFYPFRSSLFTRKSDKELEFSLNETADYLEFKAPLKQNDSSSFIRIPNFVSGNSNLPIQIIADSAGDKVSFSVKAEPPTILTEENSKTKKIWENNIKYKLFEAQKAQVLGGNININGATNIKIEKLKNGETVLGSASLSLNQKNISALTTKEGLLLSSNNIDPNLIKFWFPQDESVISLPKVEAKTNILIRIPKVLDKYHGYSLSAADYKKSVKNCDNFRNEKFTSSITKIWNKSLLRLESVNATACLSINLPTLDSSQSYLFLVENKNISGRSLSTWILNNSSKFTPIETYLPQKNKLNKTVFVLTPLKDNGNSYSLHFDNGSIAGNKTINEIGNIYIYPIPYSFLNSIRVGQQKAKTADGPKTIVNHPNPSLYVVNTDKAPRDYTLILSQGYDSGWAAYQTQKSEFNVVNWLNSVFPFVLGKKVNNHVLVNNWENGWQIKSAVINNQYVIIYLPQYLEYLGLVLAPISVLYLGVKAWKKRNKYAEK